MAKVEEYAYSVRYFSGPNSCSYLLVGGEKEARKRFEEYKQTYRRVDLLKIDIQVVDSSDK